MSADAHAAVVEGHVVERKKRGRLRKYVVYAVEVAAGPPTARRLSVVSARLRRR